MLPRPEVAPRPHGDHVDGVQGLVAAVTRRGRVARVQRCAARAGRCRVGADPAGALEVLPCGDGEERGALFAPVRDQQRVRRGEGREREEERAWGGGILRRVRERVVFVEEYYVCIRYELVGTVVSRYVGEM